jgi:two-component system OmpR family response regulator/two-component system copper resistance phosphate regulon response regulator CusR
MDLTVRTTLLKTQQLHILLVEDDSVLAKSIAQGLSEQGHLCTVCQDGAAGLAFALEQLPDLMILDVMLPKQSGMEVLAEVRRNGLECPVIMLTALGSVENRVSGLASGADDYIVKPFDFGELLARIDAVTRRARPRQASTIAWGDLSLDLTTRRMTRDGEEIELTPTECTILELLIRLNGQVVTRKMLCEHVWGFVWDGNTNVIEVHVNRLRRKLDAGRDESLIRTVRGRGYAIRHA